MNVSTFSQTWLLNRRAVILSQMRVSLLTIDNGRSARPFVDDQPVNTALMLAVQTACAASRPRRDGTFNAEITGVLGRLFGRWPQIQATCFAGGR
jgi:hypothetical protein